MCVRSMDKCCIQISRERCQIVAQAELLQIHEIFQWKKRRSYHWIRDNELYISNNQPFRKTFPSMDQVYDKGV